MCWTCCLVATVAKTRKHTDTHTHTTVERGGFQRRVSLTIFFTSLFSISCLQIPSNYSSTTSTLYHNIVLKYDSSDTSKVFNTDDRHPSGIRVPKEHTSTSRSSETDTHTPVWIWMLNNLLQKHFALCGTVTGSSLDPVTVPQRQNVFIQTGSSYCSTK